MTTPARKNMHPAQFLVIVGSLLLVVGLMAYILDGASGGPDRRAAARATSLYESGRLATMTIDQARRAIGAPRQRWGTMQQGIHTLTLESDISGVATTTFVFDTDEQGQITAIEKIVEGPS